MAITKQDFANAKIDESFGLSMDTLYNYIANNMPGSRFWYKFKDNKEQCLAVLNAVKNAGMSPALFTVKEKAEGYNYTMSWGNHYLESDVTGTEPEKAVAYAKATIKTANSTAYQPAWIDVAYPVNCVPTDVIQAGNADYAKTPIGTIKRAYVAMTAASTWSYYYPPALKASVNGMQDYGNPMQQCTDYLNEMGAKITGSGGSGSGGTTPPPEKPDVKPNVPNQNTPLEGSGTSSTDPSNVLAAIQKAIDQIMDLLNQRYFKSNLEIRGSKTGLMFTQVNNDFVFTGEWFKEQVKKATDVLNETVKNELEESGKFQDELPNGVNQTVEILLTRALKYVDSEVKYDESKDGNPEKGATDNARFMSWCVQTIHPSLKGSSHKDFFNKFNAAGYVRHRGVWGGIAKNLQIGDIVCCADNLTVDNGGKEYFIALGDDKCVEAYPWENGQRTSKNGQAVGKGIAKFKLSERAALGCADIAIIRPYSPKEVENPTPTPSDPKPPSSSIQQALAHIRSFMGNTIGNGQCYGLCAEYAGYLGGPGLGAGTKYGITGLTGQGSTAAAADIGICYNWAAYGWTMIQNPSLSQIVPGCILNIRRSANVTESMGAGTSAWFNWSADPTYGHTLVVEKVNGDSLTVLEQWGGTRQYTMNNMMAYSGSGASGISSICIPPSA